MHRLLRVGLGPRKFGGVRPVTGGVGVRVCVYGGFNKNRRGKCQTFPSFWRRRRLQTLPDSLGVVFAIVHVLTKGKGLASQAWCID